MQIFREHVDRAQAGNRVALGIPGLESKSVERALMTAPGLVPLASKLAIVRVTKIPFFLDPIVSGKRFHFSIGYSTITGAASFFTPDPTSTCHDDDENFSRSKEYLMLKNLEADKEEDDYGPARIHFALLIFDTPVFITPYTWIIASNLQKPDDSMACRLAFHGRVIETSQDKDYTKNYLPTLNFFYAKEKRGVVDRISTTYSIIVRGFCEKNSNIKHLLGLKVDALVDCDGVIERISGKIEGRFGKTNKLRVQLDTELTDGISEFIKKKGCRVELKYKEYKFRTKAVAGQRLCQ